MCAKIVGIGASAGGLEALTRLLGNMPADTGMSFVIVQHMARSAPSMLPELLAFHTPMPVKIIESGQRPAPNTVYIARPGFWVSIEDGVLDLLEIVNDDHLFKPIDMFFNALANDQGEHAYALVLSGTGSDGTIGITAIKTAGGIVIAQRGDTARFSGMPDSATATGLVDFVLAPEDIALKLIELERFGKVAPRASDELSYQRVEQALPDILGALMDFGKTTFDDYKRGTLIRRILRRMMLKQIERVEDFVILLKEEEQERKALVQDFLIGVTQFFRNPEAFAFLKQSVLTKLLERDQPDFRVWVPGCSTGQEVFSLAMMIHELQEERGDRRPWRLFGTDIDRKALATARRGVYRADDLEPVFLDRKMRFFSQNANSAEVSAELKSMCIFAPHNVLSDPPFSKIDLVSCRNLLIYIGPEGQGAILTRFHYALNQNGYLWLGPSESLADNPRLFEQVSHSARVFRREDVTSSIELPVRSSTESYDAPTFLSPSVRTHTLRRFQTDTDIETETERAFLASFAPPFARISLYDEVLYASESIRPLLRPSKGVPSALLDDYFVEALRMPLRSVLNAARQNTDVAEMADVVVELKGKFQVFDILARKLDEEGKSVLVTFQPVRIRKQLSVGQETLAKTQEAYEAELALARRQIVAREKDFEMAAQELRASNEELLTMNEELQSSNEELETSREELQSVNEELETINAELIESNRFLSETSSNIKNLLESTDIATLFIDNAGVLRLFTPLATELFSVKERDLGRSIFDLSTLLDYPDLKADLHRAEKQLDAFSREVTTQDGARTFLTKLKPYRDTKDRIDGSVISFIDITEQREQERQQRALAMELAMQVAEMEGFSRTAPIGMGLHGPDMCYLRVNQYLADTVGLTAADMIGRHPEEVVPDIWREVKGIFEEIVATGKPRLNVEVTAKVPGRGTTQRTWVANYFPIVLDTDKIIGIGVTALEVTETKRLETSLNAKRRELVSAGTRILAHFEDAPLHIIIFEGGEHLIVYANKSARAALGMPDPTGKTLGDIRDRFDIVPETLLDDVLSGGQAHVDGQVEVMTHNETGAVSQCVFKRILQPYHGAEGTINGVLLLALDITQIIEMGEQYKIGQQRISAIIDTLDAQIALLDHDGAISELNQAVADANSMHKSELYNRTFWKLDTFKQLPDVAERLRAGIETAASGRPVQFEGSFLRACDTAKRRVNISLVPLQGRLKTTFDVVVSLIDQTDLIEANAHKDIIVAELEHRVKNVIATMQAVVRFTALSNKNPDELVSELDKRLRAMAHIHERLTQTGWIEQSIQMVLEDAASTYLGQRRAALQVTGGDIYLSPAKVMIMGLAIHELITNSFKYGALSTKNGQVSVQTISGEEGMNRIVWREFGSTKPKHDKTEGFGKLLLTKVLPMELNARVTYQFKNDGFVYQLNW